MIFAGLLTLCLLNVINATAHGLRKVVSTSGTGSDTGSSNKSNSKNGNVVTSTSESRSLPSAPHPSYSDEEDEEVFENPALHDNLQGSGKVPLLVRSSRSSQSSSKSSSSGGSSRFDDL